MCTAAAVLLVLAALRRKGVDLLSAVTCAFFVTMAVIAVVDPASELHLWTCPLANTVLAVTALGSLIVGKPFTLSVARENVRKELWNNPRFITSTRSLPVSGPSPSAPLPSRVP